MPDLNDSQKIYDDIFNSIYRKPKRNKVTAKQKKHRPRRKRPAKPSLLNPHRKYHEESLLYRKRLETFSKTTDPLKKTLSDTHKHRISRSLMSRWVLIDPSGRLFKTDNLKFFCVKHDLSYCCLSKVARGIHKTHQGWVARKIDTYNKNMYKLMKYGIAASK